MQGERTKIEATEKERLIKMENKEFDLVEIPSKGQFYESESLKNKEALSVYYITTKHEDILTSPNLMASGEVLDVLLKNLMVDRDIDVESLLPGDRDAILLWARATGFGADYAFKIRCPICGSTQEDTIDLNALNMIYLDGEKKNERGNFVFELPISKKKLDFQFITYGEQRKIEENIKAKKKKLKTKIDDRVTLTLMHTIKAVDGDTTVETIRKFVNTMRPGDSRDFLKHVTNLEPRVDMSYDFECNECIPSL